jgi:hypothetical protein
MRILLSVGDRGRVGNYLMYLKDLGDVEIITPDSKIPDGDYDLLVLGGGEDIDPKLYGEEVRYENVEIERLGMILSLSLWKGSFQGERIFLGYVGVFSS